MKTVHKQYSQKQDKERCIKEQYQNLQIAVRLISWINNRPACITCWVTKSQRCHLHRQIHQHLQQLAAVIIRHSFTSQRQPDQCQQCTSVHSTGSLYTQTDREI